MSPIWDNVGGQRVRWILVGEGRGMPDGAGGSRNQPRTDFWSLGGPDDPHNAATCSEMSLRVLMTFWDVVGIDNSRHGLER